jgi:hypothetical protein
VLATSRIAISEEDADDFYESKDVSAAVLPL